MTHVTECSAGFAKPVACAVGAGLLGPRRTTGGLAQKCDAAIGITVPSFRCDAGTQVRDTHLTSSVPLQGYCD